MGPLIPDDSALGARTWRRTRGIALELLLFIVLSALLPVLLVAGGLVDAILWVRSRKRWMTVRLVAMAWWFLVGELYGLLGLLVIFAASGGRDSATRRDRVWTLKRQWLGSHLRGLRRLFGLRFELDGIELAGPGPVLVMTRHASIIDNALPDVVIGGHHRLGFRFVIKRELRMLPTIDIGGRWVPTLFVRRGSGDTEAELSRMRDLCVDLGHHEGLLLYPEGTRCTDAKLARAKSVIAEKQPELSVYADRLRYVLPPRLGGALTLLQGTPEADVVIFGHFGLDGFEYVSDIWAGGLVGTRVRLKFWRYPAASIPRERDALIAWLYERWFELDEWIGVARAEAGTAALGSKGAGGLTSPPATTAPAG